MLSIILACLGLNYLIMHAKVFNKIRNSIKKIEFFNQMLNCAYCSGFWAGVILLPFSPTILLPLISCWVCGVCEEVLNHFNKY